MREQQFRLQARRLDIFLVEKTGAFLDRFEDGHGWKSKFKTTAAKSFLRRWFFVMRMNEEPDVINNVITGNQTEEKKCQRALERRWPMWRSSGRIVNNPETAANLFANFVPIRWQLSVLPERAHL